MSYYEELKAKEKEKAGLATKTDTAMKSYDDLQKGYFEAKNKGGKAFYDFIQQHKNTLTSLFSDVPNEANLIALVPSIGEEASNVSDKKWVKEQNDALSLEGSLRDAKIAAKEQSIKEARKRYRPDLAKIEADDLALTNRIKDELKHKGYNPTDEDVRQVKQEMLKEQERVRRANEWEQKPWWQRFGYEIIAPRQAESKAMGYEPTGKDMALDALEFGSNFLPFGAVKVAPKAFNKLGKVMSKADEITQGISGLNIVGDLAKGGGELGLAEFLPSVAIRTADANLYDDGRERGEADVGEILGGATSDAITAALLGHAAKRLSPEKQKVLDAADEAIKKQAKLAPNHYMGKKVREGVYEVGPDDPVFISPRDKRIADWKQYRTFKEAGDVTDFEPRETLPNLPNTRLGAVKEDVIVEQVRNLSTRTKQQLKDFMDATGLDYIDALDAMSKGEVKIGTPEEIAFLKELQKERDKFYYENASKALRSGAIWGPAGAALKRGLYDNLYKMESEDRGYDNDK